MSSEGTPSPPPPEDTVTSEEAPSAVAEASQEGAPAPRKTPRRRAPRPRRLIRDKVETVWAVSTLIGVVLAGFFVFVAPWAIDIKAYVIFVLFAALAWAAGYLNHPSNRVKQVELPAVAGWIIFIGVFWSGSVRFGQYYVDGGADPFFYDVTLTYLAFLAPLFIWGIIHLLKNQDSDGVGAVVTMLRSYAWGYLGVWFITLFTLAILEGD